MSSARLGGVDGIGVLPYDGCCFYETKTDAAIRDALKSRRSGVTTLIISHRITTLMEADKIFVIKDGAVVEQGTHKELLAVGGIYRRTHDIQNAGADIGGEAV